MQKTIERMQKLMGWVGLIGFGLMAVYAFGMATPSACCLSYEETINFYTSIQPLNDQILYWAIAGIVVSLLHNVFRNNVRKIYYISNFVWVLMFFVVSVGSIITLFVNVTQYLNAYSTLPFDAMNEYWAGLNLAKRIDVNTPIFVLGYLEAVLLILIEILSLSIGAVKLAGRIKHEKSQTAEKNSVAAGEVK